MRSLSMQLLALVGLSLSTAAGAQTVTFNLTGRILPGVCRWAVADVDLGTYYATEFTAVGTTKPWVNVPIHSTGCDPLVTSVTMNISGTPDAANPNFFIGVPGIGIELTSPSGATVFRPTGGPPAIWTNQSQTGDHDYMLRARFRQTATTVSSGTVRSPVTLQITYN